MSGEAITSSTLFTGAIMAIRLTIPLLYAALGGAVAKKAGMIDFALEGKMLAGAFFGYYGAFLTGNPWFGLFLAALVGGLTGILFAYTTVSLKVSQLVVGIGINTFFLGLSGYLYRIISSTSGDTSLQNMFEVIRIPLLSAIPVVGKLLFNHFFLVYLGILIVVLFSIFLRKTTTGLNLRAIGENKEPAQAAGVNVKLYQYTASFVAGILASFGGAFLTLAQVSRFLENMIQGRGWIALAAVILGRSNPYGVLGACLLFGFANALSNQMQIIGVKLPYQATLMVPYILAILAVVGVVGKGKTLTESGH